MGFVWKGIRSEARASDLRGYPGLFWWNRIKQRLYEGKESEYSPRTCSIGRPAGGTLSPPYNFTVGAMGLFTPAFAVSSLFHRKTVFWCGLRKVYSVFCGGYFEKSSSVERSLRY